MCVCVCVCVCAYIYIYIYIEREREREELKEMDPVVRFHIALSNLTIRDPKNQVRL